VREELGGFGLLFGKGAQEDLRKTKKPAGARRAVVLCVSLGI
jgi:hypothetical protein